MTREQEHLRSLQLQKAELEPEQRARVSECEVVLRHMLHTHADGEALMAIALIGAEIEARA